MVGRTLLHYRILEKLGEGGMGVVYKAIDTHLDRPVAIKLLPADKVADADRRRRFTQEAKAASALNHPHIVTIYDIAHEAGLDFIVMEFVAGQTLDQLIGRRGMKLGEALGCAVQIADGLARAHAAGIVHRDLKPTNIMLGPDGRVKILDFGLAKLIEAPAAEKVEATQTFRDAQKPRTEEGFALGTAAYMSPEQAEGKTIDARSDIFSFGAVLYEMLTGQRAFRRESRLSTLTAILRDDPKPAGQINESLSPDIEAILARCLRKDPARRWQTMSDLKVALQDLKEDSDSGRLRTAPAAGKAKKIRLPLIGAAALVVIAAAAILFFRIFPAKSSGPIEYETNRLTFDSGLSGYPTVSPNGELIAYASDRGEDGGLDIWIQSIAGGKPLRLTEDPNEDIAPAFSPDGSKIAFRSNRGGGGIYIVDVLGGEARRIADGGFQPRFSPDGSWIAFLRYPASMDTRLVQLHLIPPQGGESRAIVPDFCVLNWAQGSMPVWSPDGKFLLFYGRRVDDPSSADWWTAPVQGGPPVRTEALKTLGPQGGVSFPVEWIGSDVYFIVGSTIEGVNIFRIPIEARSRKIAGPAIPVTSGPGMKVHVSVARDGRIFYSNISAIMGPWGLPARPEEGSIAGEPRKLTSDLQPALDFSLSRDGSKIAFITYGTTQSYGVEVRVKDLKSGRDASIPMRGGFRLNQRPRLSPDGSLLAYQDFIADTTRTFVIPVGTPSGREIGEALPPVAFSSSNRDILVIGGRGRLLKVNLESGVKTPVLSLEGGTVTDADISPDDRRLAYTVGKPDGRIALYVAPLGAAPISEKDSILMIQDDHYLDSPKWSPDGGRLYYLSEKDGDCGLYVQRVDPATIKPIGEARVVYNARKTPIRLNYPPGLGRLGIGRDKIVFMASETSGNIYVATPKKR